MQRWLRAGKALETGGISVSFGGFNPRPHTNVVGMWAFSNFFSKNVFKFFSVENPKFVYLKNLIQTNPNSLALTLTNCK